MLHLLFLFLSNIERCGCQCVSWVNLWKLCAYFVEETWSTSDPVLSVGVYVWEREPRAHCVHGCCRRICYGWLLEDWHWLSSIESSHRETKGLMPISTKTKWFPLALVMRGHWLELKLSLTEKAVMGTVSSSFLTWTIPVFPALTPVVFY